MANVEKKVPRDYITEDGFGITEKCRAYLEPLIAGEDYPPYKNGLPDYVTDQGRGGEEEAQHRVQALSAFTESGLAPMGRASSPGVCQRRHASRLIRDGRQTGRCPTLSLSRSGWPGQARCYSARPFGVAGSDAALP